MKPDKLFLLLFLCLASEARDQRIKVHAIGDESFVTRRSLRPIDDSSLPISSNYSLVGRNAVAPNQKTDAGEPFNREKGCVIIGYTTPDGKTTDHNMAMANANVYWKAEQDKQRKKNKYQSPSLRILGVNSKEDLLTALGLCPKGGEINVSTHGHEGNGGGFCVGPEAADCVDANDAEFFSKFTKVLAGRSPKAIWINACLVAGSVKDSNLGKDASIDGSFLNKVANAVYEEMSEMAVISAGPSGKPNFPKPVRVHGFTTITNSSATAGPISTRRDTDRLTFEADPEVQKRVKAGGRKPATLLFGNVPFEVPADFDPRMLERVPVPSIEPLSDEELLKRLKERWSQR